MKTLINSKIYWTLLLITIIGEFVVPFILSKFYKNYDGKYMVMSVLGNKKSPVKTLYNIWLIWVGALLSITSIILFEIDKNSNMTLSILELISILTFGIGAGVISGIFSVNENKNEKTLSSKIHGIVSAIGFIGLLFLPLIKGILHIKNHTIIGIINIASFIFAATFFVLFIMSDKEKFRNTIISYEGLWQRLTLAFMYIPLVCEALLIMHTVTNFNLSSRDDFNRHNEFFTGITSYYQIKSSSNNRPNDFRREVDYRPLPEDITPIISKYPDLKGKLARADIPMPAPKNMIPQGIATINGELIFITGYDEHGKENSKCYVLNREGKLLNTVTLDNKSHVGSLAYDSQNGLIWIPGPKGVLHTYSVYGFLKKRTIEPKDTFHNLIKNSEHLPEDFNHNIDYLCIDEDYLYVGTFSKNHKGNVFQYKIITKNSKIELEFIKQFKVPKYIQGITFYNFENQKYMILSQSYGRRNDSQLQIYLYDDDTDDFTTNSKKFVTLKLPPMLEQITVDENELYFIFESSAHKYEDCTAKVEYLCLLDLTKVFLK